MIKVIYETPASRFSCLYESMDDAINDIRDREEAGWKAEEIKEVQR